MLLFDYLSRLPVVVWEVELGLGSKDIKSAQPTCMFYLGTSWAIPEVGPTNELFNLGRLGQSPSIRRIDSTRSSWTITERSECCLASGTRTNSEGHLKSPGV